MNEELKQNRNYLHKAFKRASELFVQETVRTPCNKDVIANRFKYLEDVSDRLFLLEEQVRNDLLIRKVSEEEFENELDKAEQFKELLIEHRSTFEKMVEQEAASEIVSASSINNGKSK
ncbi:Hypothetical protein NTJ_03994 [Nesidiocoris tenuis]|uniref:Uncharacterized protein n=1 Tax=Nesidiocoris tenuis TaxID=355587 RepID=A0ABN7AJY8_9HEMI|nr:Hypothetical protein NTJ_03994 [Nesidiocoris tenuis]